MERETSIVKNLIAGGVGGVCAILVGQPLDIIKLRLQTQPKPPPGKPPLYTGTLDCFVKTIRTEKFIGLYKGMSVPLMMTTPIMAVSFTGFCLGKRLQQSENNAALTPMQILYAGMMAGLFTSVLTAPAERVKIILQSQTAASKSVDNKPLDVAKALYKEGGISSLYRGMIPTVIRDVSASAFYFLSYLLIRRTFDSENQQEEHFKPLQIIFAGGVSGIIGWLVGIGPDVVKSRLQIAPEGKYPKGMYSVIVEMLQKEGPSSLFKGTGPVLIRAFPGNSALFLGYEVAIKFMNYISPDL